MRVHIPITANAAALVKQAGAPAPIRSRSQEGGQAFLPVSYARQECLASGFMRLNFNAPPIRERMKLLV
jgi:hypothetical protein